MAFITRSTKVKVTATLLSGLMVGSGMLSAPVQAQQRRGRPNQSDSSGFQPVTVVVTLPNGTKLTITLSLRAFRFLTRSFFRSHRGFKVKRSAELTSENGARLTSAFSRLASAPQNGDGMVQTVDFEQGVDSGATAVSQGDMQQLQSSIDVVVQNARKAGNSLSALEAAQNSNNLKSNLPVLQSTFESTRQLQQALPVLFARVNALPKNGTPEQARALSAMFGTLSDLTTNVQAVANGLKQLQK